MKINLRGHHLLCIQGFQGYGYSDEFINNMYSIKALLNNEDTEIITSNKPDDICKFCPNLKEDICKDANYNKNMVLMDNKVLNKLKIKNKLNSKDAFKNVNKIFNSKEKIEEICKDCQWFNKCLFANKF